MRLDELKLEQDPQEVSYEIFCDMDGVLCDFAGSLSQRIFKDTKDELGGDGEYSEEKFRTDPAFRSYMWKSLALYQKRHGDVAWRDLEPMPDYKELWNYIQPRGAQILTATGDEKYNAIAQKRIWVTNHLGSAVRINHVKSAPLKAQFAGKNRILIDDQKRAVDPWIQAGGIGIVHTSAANTIAELKKLGV